MTNNEYILKTLSLFGITQDIVDVILHDSDLNPDSYSNVTACKVAILKDFHLVRAAAHRNVSEGGFSLSWNDCEKALKDFEDKLNEEVGNEDKLNGFGCIDRSNLW